MRKTCSPKTPPRRPARLPAVRLIRLSSAFPASLYRLDVFPIREDAPMYTRKLLLLVAALLLACPLAARAAPSYTMTMLPENMTVFAIGAGGQAVGMAKVPAGWAASIWSGGVVTSYGDLGGGFSEFTAISSNGMLAGDALAGQGGPSHAILYANGAMQDLGSLNGIDSYGKAVNASGQVAGQAADAQDNRAFLYANGVMNDLGTFGGKYAAATGINDAGVVVGSAAYAKDDGAFTRAFTYRDGVMTDIGAFDDGQSWANAINQAGEVVGESWDANSLQTPRAFLYANGVMTDIGRLGAGADALAINALGQIVGWTGEQDASRAFLYLGGKMLDLNTLVAGLGGWTLTSASAINDAGQIAATACTATFTCRAALLSPLDAVPEPGSGLMLLAGLAALAGKGHRRRAG
jgi:probable HAF family extracellular repeat protein